MVPPSTTSPSAGLRSTLLLMGALLCLPLGADAQVPFSGLQVAPDIDIQVLGYYDGLPSGGMMPVRVIIRNDSGRTRTWRFVFRSTGGHQLRQAHSYAWRAEVPTGEEKWFDLLVPVVPVDRSTYSRGDLRVTVTGYGLRRNLGAYTGHHPYSSKTRTACTAMSKSLAMESRGPLTERLENLDSSLVMCGLDPDWIADDWRAYQGFATVWFADRDWRTLDPSRRDAVLQWVRQGGRLLYAGRDLDPDALARVGLPPAPAEGEVRLGLGHVRTVAWNGGPLNIMRAASVIQNAHVDSGQIALIETYPHNWNLLREVQPPRIRVAVLVAALLAFAVIIGPVNLIVLAGRTRRHRLFITTPLLSVAASLLLLVVILIQDGVGGTGRRTGHLFLMPDSRQELLTQEQLSRTGLLVTRRFPLADDLHVVQIPLPSRSRDRVLELHRGGGGAGGDWFSNRSRQGQYLSAIRPSRSRVELLNPDPVRLERAAPVLVSTLAEDLTEVRYRDVHGKTWWADRLRVGEQVTLQRPDASAFQAWPSPAESQPYGFFEAKMDGSTSRMIETLASIRWQDSPLIVIGPCSIAGEGSP